MTTIGEVFGIGPAAMPKREPLPVVVYVVSFAPSSGESAVGGFDWFWNESLAREHYDVTVANIGNTHRVRLVPFVVNVTGVVTDITAQIDDSLDEVEELSRPLLDTKRDA